MKVDRSNVFHWFALTKQGIYTLAGLMARRFSAQPTRPIVVLYGHQFGGNLKALYEEWELHFSERFDCYYLSLDPESADHLERSSIRVLRCASLRDMITVGRATAIVSDHGLHAMAPLVTFTDIRFIDVWHGIPFKGFVPEQFALQHNYDEIWVSSPLLCELYEDQFGFDPVKVRDMGYARTDKLFRGVAPEPGYKAAAGIADDVRIVLYAPTWKQDDANRGLFPFGTTQDDFLMALDTVCATHNAVLLVRSHLNASIRATASGHVRYCSMTDFADTESLLLETDILICDWSSIAFDFLALDRPAIFLEVDPPFANGFSLGPEYRYGYITDSMDGLCSRLDEILADSTRYSASQAGSHKRITDAVYGKNTDGQAATRQWQRLLELCH